MKTYKMITLFAVGALLLVGISTVTFAKPSETETIAFGGPHWRGQSHQGPPPHAMHRRAMNSENAQCPRCGCVFNQEKERRGPGFQGRPEGRPFRRGGEDFAPHQDRYRGGQHGMRGPQGPRGPRNDEFEARGGPWRETMDSPRGPRGPREEEFAGRGGPRREFREPPRQMGRRFYEQLKEHNKSLAKEAQAKIDEGQLPREVFRETLENLSNSESAEDRAFADRIREQMQNRLPGEGPRRNRFAPDDEEQGYGRQGRGPAWQSRDVGDRPGRGRGPGRRGNDETVTFSEISKHLEKINERLDELEEQLHDIPADTTEKTYNDQTSSEESTRNESVESNE